MIYVKQETEDAFTALHVKPPTAQGLIGAIESKYKISGNSIRFLFKQNREGNKVKIDDDMITYYSNEAAFLMQVCKVVTDWESKKPYLRSKLSLFKMSWQILEVLSQ